MSEILIRARELGKQYRLGTSSHGARFRYKSLRDAVSHACAAPFRRRVQPDSHPASDTFWALRDISFEIRSGEVLGVIGRNGAGKSTLLKILSRITEPTTGSAEMYGRLGSLLEVGTGFHPELSGRENVFLNGAILGMKRVEVARRFDEIVDFAEVNRFIDTPVKRYSSGMYTRLAFAVAAHLETEILLVDEVLAVGDVAFQKKCLGKMHDVARGGRTVLFVSHSMSAVNTLCQRCLWLSQGRIAADGPAGDVTARYQIEHLRGSNSESDLSLAARSGTGLARFRRIRAHAVSADEGETQFLRPGDALHIELDIEAIESLPHSNAAVIIQDANGYRLIDVNTALRGESIQLRPGERTRVEFVLRDLLLKPGTYLIGLWLGIGGVMEIDSVDVAHSFTVLERSDTVRHTEAFPGPYQCRFDTRICRA